MTVQKTTLCMLALALIALAGCGIKPGHVKPPEGARDSYPGVYPAPAAQD